MSPNDHAARIASDTPAVHAGTITIGGDLTVHRMGYGAMRITGRGEGRTRAPRTERVDAEWPTRPSAQSTRRQSHTAAARTHRFGLSEVGVDMIERARRFVPIASVQNRYNVVDREWDNVVDYCERDHIVFIPWFPLGAGSLEKAAGERAAEERVERVAKRHGVSAMQVALAWLLARSDAMLVIPGTSKVKHLEENVQAAMLELTREDLRELHSLE